ncbi:hypothetical protein [Niabella soli]|uniref:Outer membrane protein beta-barrel domain-containing protein n=1 Tax=Niabella soli DSM 19437 TaxID=929713 RepID=W0F5C2_9BACT|nr:hypothetical protein [Niabella soli]AHF16546.1 hypothetical protein NIASO_17975 [Niabella soli DSM 19437]
MKKIIFLAVIAFACGTATAQSNYRQAIGIRFSSNVYYDAAAVSYKFFVSNPGAIELNLGVGDRRYWDNNDYRHARGVNFAGTYQHHFQIKPVPGLKWFVGGGLVLFNTSANAPDYDGFGAGIYPTGGIDYKFARIPLNLSADVRPIIHITAPSAFETVYPTVGIAARYAF